MSNTAVALDDDKPTGFVVHYTKTEQAVLDLIIRIPGIKKRGQFNLDRVVELYYKSRERPAKARGTISAMLRGIAVKSIVLGPPYVRRISPLGVNSDGEGRRGLYEISFEKKPF
jgi:hypothetical protein